MSTGWLIDSYLFDNNPIYRKIPDVLEELKIKHYITEYMPLADEQDLGPFTFSDPNRDKTILYGTIGFVKKASRQHEFDPGAFGFTEGRKCNVYMTNIPNQWFLNSDYVIVPFGDLKYKHNHLFEMYNTGEVFVRPLAGDKSFTGTTATYLNFQQEIESLKQIKNVGPEELVLIASSKRNEIKGEFRFIVGAGEVITGSEYRWDNILDVRADYPQECFEMVQRVVRLPWQLDTVYTCDVALMSDGTPKIVELNSFASAGWYAGDQKKIISRVTEIAESEYY